MPRLAAGANVVDGQGVRLAEDPRERNGECCWQSAGFHVFAPGSLSVTIPAEGGWYVLGFRYAEAASGRVVGGWTMGLVEVA